MKYEITKEQLQELAKGNAKVERWFPEAFETEIEKGKWFNFYWADEPKTVRCILYIDKVVGSKVYFEYGIDLIDNEWLQGDWYDKAHILKPAIESEVFEALKKEAVKRGFKIGVQFKCPYTGEVETLGSRLDYELTGTEQKKFGMCLRDNIGTVIYYKGIWSEIIKEKTLSKSEAEAKLNELINDGYDYKIG